MKLSGVSTIILLHMATSSIFFIPPIQCTLPQPGLVETLCRKTPHYHLCVFTLKSHLRPLQRRSSADIAGLARIALEVVAANASATLDYVQKVHAQTNDTQLKTSLESCTASYTKMVKELLPEALSCMDKADYKGVKRNAYTAGNLAGSCENKCKEGSSAVMTDANIYAQNLCTIVVSIVSKLPQSAHQTLA